MRPSKGSAGAAIVAGIIAAASVSAEAQLSAPSAADATRDVRRFDGTWDTTISCPDVRDGDRRAKGYVLQLVVEVKNGVLLGEYGSRNVSSWLQLEGRIDPDGWAEIAAHGLTGDPDTTFDRLVNGSPYAYNVNARFDEKRGSGRRVQLRPCQLEFVKR